MGQYNDSSKAVGYFNLRYFRDIKSQAKIKYGSDISGVARIRYLAPEVKSQAKIKYATEMSGTARIRYLAPEIKGKAVVQRFDNLIGKAGIKVYPKNKAIGIFGVKPFPKIIQSFDVIQDTFVDESVPSYNFGDYSYLKVGTDSDGKRNRSFLKFNIESLPKNIRISKAKLVLYSQDMRLFDNLEIDSCDRNWIELGITWNGHPSRKKVVNIIQVQKDVFKYEFNVKGEVIEGWYNEPYKNYGFLLKALDETKKQMKTFMSKEHGAYAPKLEIEYFDPTLYIPEDTAIHCKADIEVRRDSFLHGMAVINKVIYTNSLHCKSYIDNTAIIRAKTIVQKYNSIKSKACVRYGEELKGRVDVKTTTDFVNMKCQAIISQTQLVGHVYIPLTNDLKTIVNIQTHKHIKAKALILKDNIIAKASIQNSIDMSAKAYIQFSNDVRGIVNIIGNTKIKGKAAILRHKELKAKAQINACNQIKCYAEVQKTNSIIAKANVAAQSTMIGTAKIVATSNIKGRIDIQAQNNLAGKSYIKTNSDIKGYIYISQIQMAVKTSIQRSMDIKAKGYINFNSKIQGQAKIKYAEELKCKAYIHNKYFSSIHAQAYVDGKEINENCSYAFIM